MENDRSSSSSRFAWEESRRELRGIELDDEAAGILDRFVADD